MAYKWNIFTNNFDISGSSSGINTVKIIGDEDGNETTGDVDGLVTFISSTGTLSVIVDPLTFEVDLNISGTVQGSGATSGAVTTDIITYDVGAFSGAFQIECRCKAFDLFTPSGCGYNIFATFISNGTTTILIGQQPIFNEPSLLEDADAYFVVSGNNIILRVLGVVGIDLLWNAEITIT